MKKYNVYSPSVQRAKDGKCPQLWYTGIFKFYLLIVHKEYGIHVLLWQDLSLNMELTG